MRRYFVSWITTATLVVLLGCAQPFDSLDNVLGAVADSGAGDAGAATAGAASATENPPAASSQEISSTLHGSALGSGAYQLFDLGPALAGQEWQVSLTASSANGGFTVVLFDADFDLLMRTRVSLRTPLRHIMRADTPCTHLGVMPAYASSGGDFDLKATWGRLTEIPAPTPQVVYLNFAGATAVKVQQRSPISFGAFDGATLGLPYAGHTQAVKDSIVATVREDYAPYNVVILTSDDGPPPTDQVYSTLQFGSSDPALLGLADSVDMYNQQAQQTAIVYIEGFAIYVNMGMDPAEMGVMIGNVASHELGHLLGLYHTKDPTEVMDSTGNAWQLSGPQTFHRGPLEDTVFPTGMENSPRLLAQSVGVSEKLPAASSKPLSAAKMLRYKEIRSFADSEISHKCGLCLNPDP